MNTASVNFLLFVMAANRPCGQRD